MLCWGGTSGAVVFAVGEVCIGGGGGVVFGRVSFSKLFKFKFTSKFIFCELSLKEGESCVWFVLTGTVLRSCRKLRPTRFEHFTSPGVHLVHSRPARKHAQRFVLQLDDGPHSQQREKSVVCLTGISSVVPSLWCEGSLGRVGSAIFSKSRKRGPSDLRPVSATPPVGSRAFGAGFWFCCFVFRTVLR